MRRETAPLPAMARCGRRGTAAAPAGAAGKSCEGARFSLRRRGPRSSTEPDAGTSPPPRTPTPATESARTIERRAEPGHLADEGKRDQIAGQRSEVDAGASVGFGDGERAGGLQVEVLGGRERGRGPRAWAETVRRPWRSARVLSRARRVSAAADGESGRCVGSAHCAYLTSGTRARTPLMLPPT